MAPFRLWLHSVHVTSERDVSPLHTEEMSHCDSVADRVSCLADKVRSVGMLPHPTLDESFEVFLTAGGLYVLDEHGEERLWLPLASSTIVHYESLHTRSLDELGNVAGLLAYSAPVAPQAFGWGTMRNTLEVALPEAADQVWVFVVTSSSALNVAGSIKAQASVLQEAMEELGAHGAIRGDTNGLRSLSVTLGAGGFASVQLMQRDSNILGDDLQSRASLANRLRMTQAAASKKTSSAIAAKVMKPENSSDQVFAEASYLIAIRGHPNVAHFFGMFCLTHEGNDPSWVLMTEAHQNGSLQSHIRASHGLPVVRALKYITGLLHALVHIHSLDLIHRDVKSDNVLLTAEDRAVLIDFGIAVHSSQEARLADRCGTPGCVAPEILRTGECSVKGDVFGAGITLYETISGRRPFDRETKSETVRANAKAKIPYDLECFKSHLCEVTGVLRKMLRASSQQRHTSLAALHAVSMLAARETAEVQAVHDTEMRIDDSLAPPAQSIVAARVQSPARAHELQSRGPEPLAQSRLPLKEEDRNSMSASEEASSAQCQSAEAQNLHETAGMDGENRNACSLSNCTHTEHHQDYLPSAPRADAPVMDLLREYRRKLALKNGNVFSMPNERLPSKDPSTCAPSSSPSSAPSRSSSESTSVSSYLVSERNIRRFGGEQYHGNADVSSLDSFRSDDVKISGGSSVVVSVSAGSLSKSDSLSDPRTEVPAMELLREYGRKLVLRNGNALPSPDWRLASTQSSTSASSSSSPPPAPSRASSESTSCSPTLGV